MTWLSVIGFAATIFCYLGVNLFLSGLHSLWGREIKNNLTEGGRLI